MGNSFFFLNIKKKKKKKKKTQYPEKDMQESLMVCQMYVHEREGQRFGRFTFLKTHNFES